MTGLVEGVKTLFTGAKAPDTRAEQERQDLATARQQQDAQVVGNERDAEIGRARKAPKGRRLLLAATGEAGLPNTLGG